MQNSGKTKPGFYPVIGLVGAAGKLGKRRFVNNAARWNTRTLVIMFFTKRRRFSLFISEYITGKKIYRHGIV